MTLGELRIKQRAIFREARSKIGEIKDGMSDAEARAIECDYEKLMLEADAIQDKIDDALDARDSDEIDISRRPRGRDIIVGGLEGRGITYALRPEQRMAERNTNNTYADLTLGDYLRAMTCGARTDLEKRALSEGADSAGGYTVPETLSAQLIDLLRAKTVAIRAGARTVPLTSDAHHIARIASDPVPAWRAEAGVVSESGPTFDRVSFAPKSLAVLVKASRELLDDSLNIGTQLPAVLAAAMAVELDRVALFGTGTGNEPTGVTSMSNAQTVAHDAALTSYAPLLTARTKILTANASGVSAYIMHPRDEGTFAGLTDTTHQPLNRPPAIADVPFLTSTSVPTDLGNDSPPEQSVIVCGDFSRLLIGIRNNIRIEVLRERYADTMQYGFIAHLRADIAAEHEDSLCKITGISAS
jgi:HK97 family phage major capsid protein